MRPTRLASRPGRVPGFLLATLALLGGLGPLAGPEAAAQPPETQPPSGTVEKIVAVVEKEPVLLSEVMERFEILSTQGGVDVADTAAARGLQRQILDQLIDDKLLILEAQASGIEAGEEEIAQAVEQTIDGLIRQMGSREVFLENLEDEGLTEEELRSRYREDARHQILANRLIGREVRSKIELTDEEVRAYFQENREQLPKKPRMLRISDIFVRVRPDSFIEARRADDARLVRDQIAAGDLSFAEAARSYSDDPSSAQGGDLGRFELGDLDPAFEEAALALEPGQVSDPVRSRFGYHLIRLDGKDPSGRWAEVHHILFEIVPSRLDEARAEQNARRIRERVGAGESFQALAREASDDTASAARGGDLGWLPMDAFQGAVKGAVDSLRVGGVSEVVPGDGGYHLLMVTGEQGVSEYTFEEIQNDLKDVVFRARLEEGYKEWMEGLRDKYYIEVHPLGDL